MNPRALAAWSVAAMAIALSTTNPVYRAVVALCAINLIVAHSSGGRMRPLFIAIGVAALTSTLVSLLLNHTGAHVLARIPDGVPVFGGPITTEAVVFGLATGLGIAAAVVSVAPLTLVCEPSDLVDALPPALSRTGSAIGTALNLIPGMARSATEIRDAQRMRGWRARRIADWPDVAVPVVLTAVESSLSLAEAMDARAFGSGPRSHYSTSGWTRWDSGVSVSALLAASAFVVLRVTGAAGDWYPFPALVAPDVSIPALVCCCALILPSLRTAGSR
ncbi:MAG: energy-coupling factor transporter transmembrane protein EcfT [Candidatus Dormibacteraeota bacterium]|nr:energy-coupling factor transporter transmembrane protein EcfT [Candidatus Dormibacteraeota bacterium]